MGDFVRDFAGASLLAIPILASKLAPTPKPSPINALLHPAKAKRASRYQTH